MRTQIVEGVEVHRGSGNVFADLGLADADKLKIKTGLVIEIRKAMRTRGLTQQEAAKRMGITQPKVSDMMRGDFTNLSERKLMDCLTRLGYDIEISVRPAKAEIGHLMLTTAWALPPAIVHYRQTLWISTAQGKPSGSKAGSEQA